MQQWQVEERLHVRYITEALPPSPCPGAPNPKPTCSVPYRFRFTSQASNHMPRLEAALAVGERMPSAPTASTSRPKVRISACQLGASSMLAMLRRDWEKWGRAKEPAQEDVSCNPVLFWPVSVRTLQYHLTPGKTAHLPPYFPLIVLGKSNDSFQQIPTLWDSSGLGRYARFWCRMDPIPARCCLSVPNLHVPLEHLCPKHSQTLNP